MRRLLEIVLVQLLLLGCAIASEQQTTPGVLVIDVYSVTMPSDVIREKDFMMWARELKEGKADPKKYLPTLEVEHALGEAFDIAKEAEPASSSCHWAQAVAFTIMVVRAISPFATAIWYSAITGPSLIF